MKKPVASAVPNESRRMSPRIVAAVAELTPLDTPNSVSADRQALHGQILQRAHDVPGILRAARVVLHANAAEHVAVACRDTGLAELFNVIEVPVAIVAGPQHAVLIHEHLRRCAGCGDLIAHLSVDIGDARRAVHVPVVVLQIGGEVRILAGVEAFIVDVQLHVLVRAVRGVPEPT